MALKKREYYQNRILAAGLEPELWQPLLKEIAEDFYFERICLLQETAGHLANNRLGRYWANVDDIPELKSVSMSVDTEAWIPAHSKFAPRVMSLNVGEHFDRREIYPDSKLQRFFGNKGQFSKEGMFHLSTIMTAKTEQWMSGIWFGRLQTDDAIEDRSLNELAKLVPLIGHSMKVRAELLDFQFKENALSAALIDPGQVILFIDREMNILSRSEASEDLEKKFKVASLRGKKIRFFNKKISEAINKNLGRLLNGEGEASELFCPYESSGEVLRITIYRIIGGAGITYPTKAEFILKISSDVINKQNSVRFDLSNFGLTKRETEFAIAYLGNANVVEILHEMGISENTLKSHRKAVFDKLGVGSRFDLLKKLGAT